MNWFLENGRPIKNGGKIATAAACCCDPSSPVLCPVCEFTDPTTTRDWLVTQSGFDAAYFTNAAFVVKYIASGPSATGICAKVVAVAWPSATDTVSVDTDLVSPYAGQIKITSRFGGGEVIIPLAALEFDYCNNLEEHCYSAPAILFDPFYVPTGSEQVCVKAA